MRVAAPHSLTGSEKIVPITLGANSLMNSTKPAQRKSLISVPRRAIQFVILLRNDITVLIKRQRKVDAGWCAIQLAIAARLRATCLKKGDVLNMAIPSA
jgi:hypothetical protein